jgi:hypothetical protein
MKTPLPRILLPVFCILLFLYGVGPLYAAGGTRLHRWPLGKGAALESEWYEVYVALGKGKEEKLDVVMSESLEGGDYRASELQGRTFSFGVLDYDPEDGPLQVRVVRRKGASTSKVEIQPRRYGIQPEVVKGREAKFTLERSSRYLSVAFDAPDNRTKSAHWIRHMFCLFVDPPEQGRPEKGEAGVVEYNPGLGSEAIRGAKVLYFPAGHHDLRQYSKGGAIADGILTVADGQSVYLESGAFVEGLLTVAAPLADRGQRLFGRGILTGRKHPWYNFPRYRGPRYQQLVRFGMRAEVSGVTLIESPAHGLVAGNGARIQNIKYVGWHCNNDGIRVGQQSEVSDSFVRAVDDHFYNFAIRVRDCVLWAGHNGAILTYGWGGTGEAPYNAGASVLERIDVIHPEWETLGNNNGLVAAQTGLEYRPFGYGGDPGTTLRDIRIDGVVPGLLNLKPHTDGPKSVVVAKKVPKSSLGYLGDLTLEGVTVDGQQGKSIVHGAADAATDGREVYWVKNLELRGVRVGREEVTEQNLGRFFELDRKTVQGVKASPLKR